jgi:hypothetical protein
MIDHSLARKRSTHGSPRVQEELDPLFDMIDERVDRMVQRSSTIDSQLDDLEARSRSPSLAPVSSSPVEGLVPSSQPHVALEARDDAFEALYEAIANLSAEITAVREEQRILSVQATELHRVVRAGEL